MTQNNIQVALVQSDLVWENPLENKIRFTEKIHAVANSVDIIILPEMFTTGFTMSVDMAEAMNGETVLWMQELASQKQSALVGSIIVKEHDRFYNRLLFVHPNGKVDHYDKHNLFALSGEDEVFTAGKKQLIIDFKGWKICPLICYDLRFPEWSRNTFNYDLLLYVASWPKKRITAWEALLKARAIENMTYTIGVNRIGVDGSGFEYSGNSVAFDTLGEQISAFKPNMEQIEIVDLLLDKQKMLRTSLGFLNGI